MDLKRGIFQGDSLSPLLFVLCLIPSTVILHKSENAYQFSSNKEKTLSSFQGWFKVVCEEWKGLDSLV